MRDGPNKVIMADLTELNAFYRDAMDLLEAFPASDDEEIQEILGDLKNLTSAAAKAVEVYNKIDEDAELLLEDFRYSSGMSAI